MSIIISGASGFLGENLKTHLISSGQDVIGITRKDSISENSTNNLKFENLNEINSNI